MKQDEVVAIVRQFVARTRGELVQPIGPETALLDNGLLDSLGCLDLLEELGAAFSLAIEPSAFEIDDFENAGVLWRKLSGLPRR